MIRVCFRNIDGQLSANLYKDLHEKNSAIDIKDGFLIVSDPEGPIAIYQDFSFAEYVQD